MKRFILGAALILIPYMVGLVLIIAGVRVDNTNIVLSLIAVAVVSVLTGCYNLIKSVDVHYQEYRDGEGYVTCRGRRT
jgi:uncharacterized membrane protein